MKSLEIIQDYIKWVKGNLEKAKEENVEVAIKQITDSLNKAEQIKKDLEVLDQLSNILSADYLFRVFNYEIAKEIRDYLKSNGLVKEWLEE